MIWKAAIHPWRGALDQVDLGPYDVQFRRFLLGQATFPQNATLTVDISRPENRLKSVFGGPVIIRGFGWPASHKIARCNLLLGNLVECTAVAVERGTAQVIEYPTSWPISRDYQMMTSS